MKISKIPIHFYKRNDSTSLDYVGESIYKQIEKKFNVDIFNIGQLNQDNSNFIARDIGIVYGLTTDLHWLKKYKIRIAGLVCEAPLTPNEIERIYEANLTEIWVPSHFCKDLFNGAGFKRVKIIPHGVNNLKIRKKHKVNNSLLMIFNSCPSLGFSTLRKGIVETIEALKYTRIKLVLRTKKQSYYSNYNLKNIAFIEDYAKKIDNIYHSCDAILCPSYAEGFGLIGLEALSCGIPLISTKTGNDYLTDDVDYIELQLPISSNNILTSIKEFYSRFNHYNKLSIQQASSIQKQWNWDKIGIIVNDRVLELLNKK